MTVEPLPVPSSVELRYAGVPEREVGGQLGRLVVFLAQRYGLDPALKHVEVIPARGGLSVYITADGWRFIADRSGLLDGLTFENVERGDHGWRATALAWRKGCAHPFEGRAGCGFAEKRDDPEAIAMTRATRRALRNAFASAIRLDGEYASFLDDDDLATDDDDSPTPAPALVVEPKSPAVSSSVSAMTQAEAHRLVGSWNRGAQTRFLAEHGIDRFGEPWPVTALAALVDLEVEVNLDGTVDMVPVGVTDGEVGDPDRDDPE